MVGALASRVLRCQFVIDWHNYGLLQLNASQLTAPGFSILALAQGRRSAVVRVAHVLERVFGRMGSANLCVTDAMRADLRDHWGIRSMHVWTLQSVTSLAAPARCTTSRAPHSTAAATPRRMRC